MPKYTYKRFIHKTGSIKGYSDPEFTEGNSSPSDKFYYVKITFKDGNCKYARCVNEETELTDSTDATPFSEKDANTICKVIKGLYPNEDVRIFETAQKM